MGWTTTLKIDGINLGFTTDCFIGTLVGFTVDDEETLQLLRSKDTRILDALSKLPDMIDDISTAMWASDPFWWDSRQHDGVEKYLQQLRALQNNQFATDEQKERALNIIPAYAEKTATKKEKAARSKQRRSQFQSKRDALALALIERDGYICQGCGVVENLTIDHIIPLSKGGTDDPDNLQWLCQSCNSKKGDKIG